MIVYRVEHKTDRQGPYNSKYNIYQWGRKMYYAHRCKKKYPGISNEQWADRRKANEMIERINCVFGFKSVQDLKSWFSGFLRELNREGFVISVYETEDEVLEGEKQVMFIRGRKTKRVKEFSPLSPLARFSNLQNSEG